MLPPFQVSYIPMRGALMAMPPRACGSDLRAKPRSDGDLVERAARTPLTTTRPICRPPSRAVSTETVAPSASSRLMAIAASGPR